MFIHADITKLDLLTKWAAMLRGGLVALPQFLTSGGKAGGVMVLHAATATRRRFWISPGFKRLLPELAELIEKCTGGTSWTPCARETFLKAEKGKQCIGLVSPEEATIINRPNGMTANFAAESFMKIDIGMSAMGVATSRPPQCPLIFQTVYKHIFIEQTI